MATVSFQINIDRFIKIDIWKKEKCNYSNLEICKIENDSAETIMNGGFREDTSF